MANGSFLRAGEALCCAGEVEWDAQITVPFSPETEASGVKDTGYYTAVWYRRTWVRPNCRSLTGCSSISKQSIGAQRFGLMER